MFAPYLDQVCIIQFAAGNAWLSCAVDGDSLGLSLHRIGEGKDEKVSLIPAPYVIGKIVHAGARWAPEPNPSFTTGHYAVEIEQENGGIVEVALNPAHVFSISVVGVPSRPKKKPSSIIIPGASS